MIAVNMLVEGPTDEFLARRLIQQMGRKFTTGTVYGKQGYSYIEKKAAGFDKAARYMPLLVLSDLWGATGCACPPEVVKRCLPNRIGKTLFRVVVHELESWVLADRDNCAKFLQIPSAKIPTNPDKIQRPKLELINLAKQSKSRNIREGLVPSRGSSANIGQEFVLHLCEFLQKRWNPQMARRNSPSLDRCLVRLNEWKKIL